MPVSPVPRNTRLQAARGVGVEGLDRLHQRGARRVAGGELGGRRGHRGAEQLGRARPARRWPSRRGRRGTGPCFPRGCALCNAERRSFLRVSLIGRAYTSITEIRRAGRMLMPCLQRLCRCAAGAAASSGAASSAAPPRSSWPAPAGSSSSSSPAMIRPSRARRARIRRPRARPWRRARRPRAHPQARTRLVHRRRRARPPP